MTGLSKCPGCDVQLLADDLRAQVAHMQDAHPEIIQARLEASGFALIEGEWVDQLTDGSEG